jgi:hypothetical protein
MINRNATHFASLGWRIPLGVRLGFGHLREEPALECGVLDAAFLAEHAWTADAAPLANAVAPLRTPRRTPLGWLQPIAFRRVSG